MNKIFTQKKQYYNLRITNLLSFPKVIGSKYGTNTFVFRATDLSKYGTNTFVFRATDLLNQVSAIKMNQTQNVSKSNSRETGKLLNVHALVANK